LREPEITHANRPGAIEANHALTAAATYIATP